MAKKKKELILGEDQIENLNLDDELSRIFIDYAIAIASDRAVPNALDNCKPVHRRILYAMHLHKLYGKRMKTQRIVGDVMGQFHPHGDSDDSITYLVDVFRSWLPMILGHGNWNDINGNGSAAPRYTEAGLSEWAALLTKDVSKALVDYEANYDNTTEMPIVFPAPIPIQLINGSRSQPAVGFASSIAPHNPIDACRLLIAYLQNPTITLDDMIKIIKGPDFPTGGILIGDVKEYYETGKSSFKIRAKIDIINDHTLVIKEIPFTLGGSVNNLITSIKDLISKNKLPGIKRIDKFEEGDTETSTNIEITIDKKLNPQTAIDLLYRKTPLESTYSTEWIALDDLTPRVYNLQLYLEQFAAFRHKTVIRYFKEQLRQDTHRLEIVNGILTLKDPNRLLQVIKIARDSSSKDQTIQQLKETFNYTDVQAEYIANRRIYQLSHVDFDAYNKEHDDLVNRISWEHRYIKERDLRNSYIIQQLEGFIELFEKAKLTRRTQLLTKIDKSQSSSLDNLFVSDVTITVNKYGYIKMTAQSNRTEDFETVRIETNDADVLCCLTNKGGLYQIPIKKLTMLNARDKKARGDLAATLFNFKDNSEQPRLYIAKSELDNDNKEFVFVTASGLAKRFDVKHLLTSNVNKYTQAYKFKTNQLPFEDELIGLTVIEKDAIDTLDIIAIKEGTMKHLPLTEIKYQGSKAGAGAQTFVEKRHQTPIIDVYVFDPSLKTIISTLSNKDFDASIQPLMKSTQTFKPIDFTLDTDNEIINEVTVDATS